MSTSPTDTALNASPSTPWAPHRPRTLPDLGAMALYCTVVHIWSITVGPFGFDAARLAGEAGLSGPSAWALEVAVQAFGGAVMPYHLLNGVLIYACMVCVYFATNRLTAAPSWLGVLAANLWMANPGHREATVSLTGMVDLLPCLAALLAVIVFLAHDARPSMFRLLAAGVFIALALAFPENQWIGGVLLCFGLISKGEGRGKTVRTMLCMAAVVAGLLLHERPSLETASLFDRYGALYFCLYGIGFLPETAARFADQAWLGWLATAVVVLILVLVHWKAARPAFPVVIAGMLFHRSTGAVQAVDPVHLAGGGSLVFATALFMIGVGVLYARSMEHKRWSPILGLTSITISVVFFLLMITTIAPWREASRLAAAYHGAAVAVHQETGEPVAVVPDFHAMDGAPLQLSRLLSHETPFGPAVPHQAALPLDYAPPEEARFALLEAPDGRAGMIEVTGPHAAAVLRPWARQDAAIEHVDGGYRIPLPMDIPAARRHTPLFGGVLWVPDTPDR